MRINEITHRVIGLAYEVHGTIGPGLLESAYQAALAIELQGAGLGFIRQHPLPLMYKGQDAGCGYRADFVVEGQVLLELKAVAALERIHSAQVITYLRIADCPVGLLLNFKVGNMRDGIRRIVLGLKEGAP